MNIEQQPVLLPSVQEGKTEFYENLISRSLERRVTIQDGMTWLHPVRRLLETREVARIDRSIVAFTATLEQSRLADDVLSQAAAPTEIALQDDAAANHTVAVV